MSVPIVSPAVRFIDRSAVHCLPRRPAHLPHYHLSSWPALLALAMAGLANHADAGGLPTLPEITISSGREQLAGSTDSASEGSVSAKQLAARPLLRPAEVMETVPGMIVTQHSGDGKANQYFLRGFNLDHGSDFATSVNGMPINNLTHAHGQGYMDLNFLIPELVGKLSYRKGVYAAADGDLAVTGAAQIDYVRTLAAPFVDVSVGAHAYRRTLAAGSTSAADLNLLAALEIAGNDGPWQQPEGLHKTNAVLRAASGTAANGYALTAMAYDAAWTATEHVPERAISSGEIGRYGSLGPTDGGRTHRYSLSADWARGLADGKQQANVYVVDYGLNLFSSPSALLSGQHEQADQRTIWGGQLSRTQLFNVAGQDSEAQWGVQFRQDRIGKLGLYQTNDRQRIATVREDRVSESAIGLFAELRQQWLPWLRGSAGLRWDSLRAEVSAQGGVFNSDNGGKTHANQFSPKLGLVLGPFGAADSELFANWGRGFHSNDARGATARSNPADGSAVAAVPLLVKASGGEIGLRTQPLPGWHSSLSLWQMALASELVFIGDEGVTEPKGASRRHGLEWSNYYSHAAGLIVDADLALSQARFAQPSNGGSRVPNAIPLTASLAATLDRGGQWFGGLRLRYLGAYPLEESGSIKSTAFWVANLKAGYRVDSKLQFTVDVLNLFDRQANDIEYWGASCTRSEGAGCNAGNGSDGRMIHPLEPRTLRLGMRLSF